jgi:hypothetical protein
MTGRRTSKLDRIHTQNLVEELFEGDLHARRVLSLGTRPWTDVRCRLDAS